MPSGERAIKVEMTKNTDGSLKSSDYWNFTSYMRDASGNVLNTITSSNGPENLTNEYSIYGSSRLGTWSPNVPANYLDSLNAYGDEYRLAGEKAYELSNHLGNVMVVVGDKKLGIDNNADDKANAYYADVISMNDYYAFGMRMPGRSYSSPSYRYGFNGEEKDDETYGAGGSSYNYGFRIYNSRLGRFLSVDPLTIGYPMLTPYQFASNRPIDGIDLDGLEWAPAQVRMTSSRPQLRVWRNPNQVVPNPTNAPEWEYDNNGHISLPEIPEWKKALDNNWQKDISIEKLSKEGLKTYSDRSLEVSRKMQEINHYSEAIKRIQTGNAHPSDWLTINLADRKWLAATMKIFPGHNLPIQDHHLIPQQLRNDPVVKLAIKGGYDFDGNQNLIPVFAYRKDELGGQHANHPQYNSYITGVLNNWIKDNPNATTEDAYDFIMGLNLELRQEIRINPNEKINDIGKRLNEKRQQ